MNTPRPLKARPELAIVPVMASPLNCFALFGFGDRVFRERIVPKCRGVVRVTPRLPLVAVEEVQRVLAELAASGADDAQVNDAPDNDDGQPVTQDAVLARLGKRRTK